MNQLPETQSGQRMLSRVAPIYDNSYFIKKFYDALGTDFDKIRRYFESLRKQSFIDTVDWGIDYQELKYSLDLRPDLTLEERRARLGIKARQHLPLNPAVLEKFILDNFNVKTYLDERTAGYINLILNRTTEKDFNDMMTWLFREKPAHLDVITTYYFIEYTGGDGELEDDNPVYPPDEAIVIPNNCPRLFLGVAELWCGDVTIEPARVTDQKIIMHAGFVEVWGGEIFIDCEGLK